MHKRNIYLERIQSFLGKPVVKVITGMRRVGKSYLLRQVIDMLREEGVPKDNIHYVDMEFLDFEHIRAHGDLYEEARHMLLQREGMKYLLVDEVQEISGWERAVASLSGRQDMDVLLTGSNAHLFSSELATLLSGRYVEFPVYGLGFGEYLQFRGDKRKDTQSELLDYLRYGGLPAIHHFRIEDEMVFQYVSSIYNTILLKDVVRRHGVRNVELLEKMARYLFDNIGNVMSAKNIADYVKSQRLRVGERRYIQMAYLLATLQVVDREFGVLRDIPDNYPKCVISMDTAFGDDMAGIQCINLADFLLEKP